MYNLDKQNGNTGSPGKYFWRIENNTEKDSLEKCMAWSMRQRGLNMRDWYDKLIRSDWRMACPCTEWQAWLDWGRFSWDWWSTWPDWCYESRRVKFIPFPMNSDIRGFTVRQQCCYSTNWDDWGSLKVGPPDGGHVKVDDWFNQVEEMEEMYTDRQAYQICCVDTNMCEHFYFYRPSDHCSLYRPPLRRKFSPFPLFIGQINWFIGRINCWFLWREESLRTRRKTLRARTRPHNKLNPHVTPGPGIEPQPQHHCASPAPLWSRMVSFFSTPVTSNISRPPVPCVVSHVGSSCLKENVN